MSPKNNPTSTWSITIYLYLQREKKEKDELIRDKVVIENAEVRVRNKVIESLKL